RSARRVVRLAVRVAPVGDAVILEPQVRARAARGKELADLLHRKIEDLVAVVLAIPGVARIALGAAPHLARGLGVAAEGQHSRLRAERRVRSRDGTGTG